VHVLTSVDEEQIAALRERDEFFWVDLVEPGDEHVDRLGGALGLHDVALEDTREFGQRPKLDSYDGHLLLVFFTARVTGEPERPAQPLEIHLYVSGGFIASVRRDACDALDDLHRSLASEPTHDEELLVYRVLDGLTDAFYPVVEALEAEIDQLEGDVLDRPKREQLARGYRLKQCVHELQRLSAAQRDQFQTARETIVALPGFATGARPYLRDVADHLVQIAGEFQRQTEDLTSLTQTYFNANTDRLNATVTKLTIVGTLFVLFTVVTGFFGQNFRWLVDSVSSRTDFLIYGVGGLFLPAAVLGTVLWLKRDDWF
jgi:magnesium transporter